MTDERKPILQHHKKKPELGGRKKGLFTVIVQKINKAPLQGSAADNKQIISVSMEHIVWQAECSLRLYWCHIKFKSVVLAGRFK